MKIEEIRYFREISSNILTSGQPTAEQLNRMQEFGVKAVINLALPNSDFAIADEASIVTNQGIIYIQIPIDFSNPKKDDFELFSVILDFLNNKKILIHCALNMRVSVFVNLYQVLNKNLSMFEAQKNIFSIWQTDTIWQSFIDEIIGNKNKVTIL